MQMQVAAQTASYMMNTQAQMSSTGNSVDNEATEAMPDNEMAEMGAGSAAEIGEQLSAQAQQGVAEMPAVSATPETGELASYQGQRVDISA